MRIERDTTGSLEAFALMLASLDNDPACSAIAILSCAENGLGPKDLDPLLLGTRTPVFGGVFPSLILNRRHMHRGTVMIGLGKSANIHLVPGMSDPQEDYEAVLDKQVGLGKAPRTLLVFVDGMSQRISAFISAMYALYGLEPNYIGGGAGSLSKKSGPCLMTNRGMHEDCALLVELEIPSGVGIAHGWQPVQGSFKVTESDCNVIRTLDWEPAFSVYSKVLEEHAGIRMTEESFYDLARAYPFGITRLYGEHVVRDPIHVGRDGSLTCVGEVPKGSFVDVLHGDANSLLRAARQAGNLGLENLNRHRPKGDALCLLITCISRALFLGDEFQREIDAMPMAGGGLVGVCTLGEIANSGEEFIEFYNKTVVAAYLESA